MAKEMLINVSEGEECRIALLEDGRLEELYMERSSSALHVGNIYKGKVTNVEPSIQAAFIDFGLGRNGFLHISDLMPSYFGQGHDDVTEAVGRKLSRRDRPPIQRCLRRGDSIVVQIIKEGIGTKGPTLTTYLSVPGQILVMMPGMGKMGVSKKIEDEPERKRLRMILDGLKPPKDCGFIIRTSGIGRTKTEIERDLKYLARLWETLKKKEASGPGPIELYTEGDLITRTVRDVFSTDIDRIIVDSKDVAKRVKEVIKITSPRTKNKVELYDEGVPLFHKYEIEREIELMYSRHVPLPGGGSLVIDSTEAIVAIDVNSGKFREHNDAEMTAFKTDMEAADEIPRQLKLRDLGGVIICDFIDLRFDRHRRELEQRLHDNFKRDRAKTKVLRMSQFGIIELTRQRMRPSLKRSIYFDCPHCKGAGLVKTPESMSIDVMRRIAIAAHDERVIRIEACVHPDVEFYLSNKKRASLSSMEEETKKRVVVRGDHTLALDEIKWQLFDARDGMVILEAIGMTVPVPQQGLGRPMQGRRDGRDQRGRDGRGRDSRNQRPPRDQQVEPPLRAMDMDDDRFEMDQDEEADALPTGRNDRRGPAQPARQLPAARQVEGQDEAEQARTPQDDDLIDDGEARVLEGEVMPAEPGDAPEGIQQENTDDGGDGQGHRRRRRRRGRRGRGGGGQQGAPPQEPLSPMLENNGEQDVELSDDEPEAKKPSPAPTRSASNPRNARALPAPSRRRGQQAPSGNSIQPVEPAENLDESDTEDDSVPGPGNEAMPPEEAENDKPRRRRRGGRRHRRGREENDNQSAGPGTSNRAALPAQSQGNRRSEPAIEKAPLPVTKTPAAPSENSQEGSARYPVPPQRIEQPPVVRTGSTDKHLVSDVPVDPQPVRRPRSYSDLDAIPDDFD